tara:strand:- start:3264 stop:4601 length:1338 start_codon:yes stop_codon:yes gene_type:complete
MRASLGLRLFLTAAATTILALAATALVLNVLFRDYFEARVHDELDNYLLLLTGNIALDDEGALEIAPMFDQRFEQALSGYYWQIELEDAPPLLSPSFWAAPLELARPAQRGTIFYQDVMTGTGEPVSVASWIIELGEAEESRDILISVAMERKDIDVSVAGFASNTAIWLAILGLFLLAASAFTVRVGLKPLDRVRNELRRINAAQNRRLSNDYPSEVLPLVKEVNELLDQNDATLARVRVSAGNLAHGLKTPLTVLRGVLRKLELSGQAQMAAELGAEIDAMQHIVERELARSRDSHQKRSHTAVAPVAERLCAALRQQPAARHLQWTIDVPSTLAAPFDAYDLTELLGNLLDNAMKWTRTTVTILGGETGETAFLSVVDDGPGIAEDKVEAALARGERLDAQNSGSGLGLHIVREMADSHGCTITLGASKAGGLEVRLTWALG